MTDQADVVVIGGGCTGTSAAWQLARRQAGRIVLLEKTGLATGGTGRSTALVRQHYLHAAPARLALHSLRVFERFAEEVGGEAEFRQTGCLILVSPRDVEAMSANVAMHREIGIDARVLTPTQVTDLEPRLDVETVGAAAWEPLAGYADPVGTTAGFAAAGRRLGVDQRIGVTVTRLVAGPSGIEAVETDAGTIATRTVLVAAGYRSRELVAPLGLDLPISPIRHACAIVERSPAFGQPHPIVLDHAAGGSFRPEGSTLTLVGAPIGEHEPEDPEVEAERSPGPEVEAALVTQFYRRFPSEGAAQLRRSYTGVFDCTPDMQPFLGAVPDVPGLFVAAGFSGHGFKLSPAIGEVLAEAVLDGHASLIDLELFSPTRFAEGRPIGVAHPYSRPTLG